MAAVYVVTSCDQANDWHEQGTVHAVCSSLDGAKALAATAIGDNGLVWLANDAGSEFIAHTSDDESEAVFYITKMPIQE